MLRFTKLDVGHSEGLQEQPTLLEAVPSFSVLSRIICLCDDCWPNKAMAEEV